MKYGIYAVRDKLAGYMNLAIEGNDAIACRSFGTLVNSGNSVLSASPSDFDLYKLGSYDSESGSIESCTPSFVCSGSSVFVGVGGEKGE